MFPRGSNCTVTPWKQRKRSQRLCGCLDMSAPWSSVASPFLCQSTSRCCKVSLTYHSLKLPSLILEGPTVHPPSKLLKEASACGCLTIHWGKKPWLVASANCCGVNIPTTVNGFKPPLWPPWALRWAERPTIRKRDAPTHQWSIGRYMCLSISRNLQNTYHGIPFTYRANVSKDCSVLGKSEVLSIVEFSKKAHKLA